MMSCALQAFTLPSVEMKFRIIASGKTNKHSAKYTDLLIKILPFR